MKSALLPLTDGLFSLLGLVILMLAFLVLVATFFWVSRILALHPRGKTAPEPREESAVEPEEDSIPEPQEKPVMGKGYGANYGFVLGVLACGLFWISPLMLALSLVGMFYCGRSLWGGIKYFRTIIFRALVGLALSMGSVGLHYWKAIGGLPELF